MNDSNERLRIESLNPIYAHRYLCSILKILLAQLLISIRINLCLLAEPLSCIVFDLILKYERWIKKKFPYNKFHRVDILHDSSCMCCPSGTPTPRSTPFFWGFPGPPCETWLGSLLFLGGTLVVLEADAIILTFESILGYQLHECVLLCRRVPAEVNHVHCTWAWQQRLCPSCLRLCWTLRGEPLIYIWLMFLELVWWVRSLTDTFDLWSHYFCKF